MRKQKARNGSWWQSIGYSSAKKPFTDLKMLDGSPRDTYICRKKIFISFHKGCCSLCYHPELISHCLLYKWCFLLSKMLLPGFSWPSAVKCSSALPVVVSHYRLFLACHSFVGFHGNRIRRSIWKVRNYLMKRKVDFWTIFFHLFCSHCRYRWGRLRWGNKDATVA